MIDSGFIRRISNLYLGGDYPEPYLYKINLIYDKKNINPGTILKNYFEFIGLCVEENSEIYDNSVILNVLIGEAGEYYFYHINNWGNYIYISDSQKNFQDYIISITKNLIKESEERKQELYNKGVITWSETRDTFKEELLFVAESYVKNKLFEVPLYNITNSDLCEEAVIRYGQILNDVTNYNNQSEFIKYITLKIKVNINKYLEKGYFRTKYVNEELIEDIKDLFLNNLNNYGLAYLLGESLLLLENDICISTSLFSAMNFYFTSSKIKLIIGGLLTSEYYKDFITAKEYLDDTCFKNSDNYLRMYYLGLINYYKGSKKECTYWADKLMCSMQEKFDNCLLSPSEYKFLYHMVKEQRFINGNGYPGFGYGNYYEYIEEADAIDSYIDSIIPEEGMAKEKLKKMIKTETKRYLKTEINNFEKMSYFFD